MNTLYIIFKNWTKSIIKEVVDYGMYDQDFSCFWFVKDGRKNFIPREEIIYFGCEPIRFRKEIKEETNE